MKTENIITISPWHLSSKTLDNYIISDPETGRPPLDAPWDIYMYRDTSDYVIVESMRTNDYFIETDTDNETPIPKDLLELLNWMISENIKFLQFDDSLDNFDAFTDEEWIEVLTTETFLPFYDIDEIQEKFKTKS